MDICDNCGSVFLPGLQELSLVELWDVYGIWHEWLCSSCVDEAVDQVERGDLIRAALFGFELPHTG
jgi:hypothetical protein